MVKINQKVGFRFITKFGEKGIVNLGKMVPAVGAIIGGGIDFVETKTIGNRSIKWFFNHDFSADDSDIDAVEYSDVEQERNYHQRRVRDEEKRIVIKDLINITKGT